MEAYHWVIRRVTGVLFPGMYASHAHYETDYHGLLLCECA